MIYVIEFNKNGVMDIDVLMMGMVRLILKACPWIIVGSVFGLAAL
jgi:hypothetical protein